MRKLCAKIVPKVLTDEQKQGHVDCCNDWIESAQDPHFSEKLITGGKAGFTSMTLKQKGK